jgi:hypothetical protein
LENNISGIVGCTNIIRNFVRRARYTDVASVDQRYPRGARRQWVLQEDQVQELQAGLLRKCQPDPHSLTKFMLDRDEDSTIANLKND